MTEIYKTIYDIIDVIKSEPVKDREDLKNKINFIDKLIIENYLNLTEYGFKTLTDLKRGYLITSVKELRKKGTDE